MRLRMIYPIHVIGDVHGNINAYWKLMNKHNIINSIQVGDFGFRKENDWFIENIDSNKHKICFGNHDYYPYFDKPYSLGNFSVINDKIMTIRGGYSIDKYSRFLGLDYFHNEELSYFEQCMVYDEYVSVKPDIVISHECPSMLVDNFVEYVDIYSSTSKFLNKLLSKHKPKKWIFGHYHKSFNEVIDGVNFICLNELEVYEIKS